MSSIWFNVIVIIVAAATIGLSIANIVYYNRIKNNTCGAVSNNEANTMLWLNIVMIVLAAILFLWGIANLIFTSKTSCLKNTTDNQYCQCGYQKIQPVVYTQHSSPGYSSPVYTQPNPVPVYTQHSSPVYTQPNPVPGYTQQPC